MNLTLLLCLSVATQNQEILVPRIGADPAYKQIRLRHVPEQDIELSFRSTVENARLDFFWIDSSQVTQNSFMEPAAENLGISVGTQDGYPLGLRARTITDDRYYIIEAYLPNGYASFRYTRALEATTNLDPASPNFIAARSDWSIAFRQFCARLAGFRAGSGDSFRSKLTEVEFQKVTQFESLDGVWPNASQVRIVKGGNELIFVLGANGYKKNGVWQDLQDAPIVRNDELFVPSSAIK